VPSHVIGSGAGASLRPAGGGRGRRGRAPAAAGTCWDDSRCPATSLAGGATARS